MLPRRAWLAMGMGLLTLVAGCAAPPGAPQRQDRGLGSGEGSGAAGAPPFHVAPQAFDRLGARPVLVALGGACPGPCPGGLGFTDPAYFHALILLEDQRAVRVEFNFDAGEGLHLHRDVRFDATDLRDALRDVPAAQRNAVWVVRLHTGLVVAEPGSIVRHLDATWTTPGPGGGCADCIATSYWFSPAVGDVRRADAGPLDASDPFLAFRGFVHELGEAVAARGSFQGGEPGDPRAPSMGPVPGCHSRRATELYEVIRHQEAWVQRWTESCAPVGEGSAPPRVPPAPRVDWPNQTILAAFWGEKASSGYTVEVRHVTQTATHDVVEVVRTAPGPGCVAAAVITYPGVFLAGRELKPVEFRFTDVVKACA